jgi:glutathione S-transferase
VVAEALTLYVIHGSHPCASVEAGLRVKELDYRTVYLQFGLSQFAQAARFGRRTVPGLTVGTQKVSGSRLILRALDGLAAGPALVPPDPDLRAAVDEADVWGDDVLQHQVRWIAVDAIRREPSVALAYGSKSAPPLPAAAIPGATKALFTTEMKLLGQTEEQVRDEYVPALPAHLDRIDALIADGVLGGEQVNVADCQVAGSVRLLQTFEDLREGIDARPCGALARRLVPDYDGSMPRGVIDSPL